MKIYFQYIIYLTILFSHVFAIKCNFGDNHHRTRPNTDTNAPSPSGHFLIHYDETGIHAPPDLGDDGVGGSPSWDLDEIVFGTANNGIPDFVDEVGTAADAIRDLLINMGYDPEISDGNEYDIYIQDYGDHDYGENFGYCNTSNNNDPLNGSSYFIMDNEFECDEYYTCEPGTIQLTVAHEFFHAIQRGYENICSGSDPDLWFYEMSSTWIEDILVPDTNDYLHFLDNFIESPTMNISSTNGYSIALFGHYLSTIIESEWDETNSTIMREIWNSFGDTGNALSSISLVLLDFENQYSWGERLLPDLWADFCSRNYFNQAIQNDGNFENIDNGIYYYVDQTNAFLQNLGSGSPEALTENNQFILNLNIESISQKSFNANDLISINLEHTIGAPYVGYASIISSSDFDLNQNLVIDGNSANYYLEPSDQIIFTYARASGGGTAQLLVDINYNDNAFNEVLPGDVNLDDTINVIDITLLVSYIFNNEAFNQFQLSASDLNSDGIYNIVDLIMIVDIILN